MNATIKWLYDVPGRRRGYVLVLAVLQAVTGFIGVFYALLLRNIVDSAVAKNGAAFWYNVFLIILLVVARLGLNALYRWIYELASSEIENCFKARLTHYILKKDYAAVTAIHSGEWMNRLTNDTVVAAKGFTDILPGLVGMLVRLVSALVMIILLDKWFACILIPGGIVLIFLTYAFRRVLKKLHKNIQEKDGVLRVFLQERTGNLMVLKSFTAEDQTEQEAKDLMADHKNARMKRNHFSNFCNIGFGAAMQGMYLMGAVYCAWGILTGRVTYGTMTAVMQLIGQVQAPFANITGYLPRIYAMTASAERLMEIETFPEDYSGTIEEIEEIRRFYEDGLAAFGLRDVSFRYNRENADKMPIVLNNLSLEIEKGEYIAFTGHSGCGKSTVLKLLMCMYPIEEGSRFLRSEDGEERELTSAYRRLFAYVPQGNALVSGTIREAVSLSDPSQADDEQRIREALRIACAEEFVDEQSEGIDTLLGERGTGLSEGQMQRIAIARAIFSGNPVLLLDEATSALDELTEAQLLKNLRRLTDKTVVIVTHRKAAFTICDRVIRFTEEGDIYPVVAGDNEPGIT